MRHERIHNAGTDLVDGIRIEFSEEASAASGIEKLIEIKPLQPRGDVPRITRNIHDHSVERRSSGW